LVLLKITDTSNTEKYEINGKEYLVKNIYTDNTDKTIQDILLNLAEKKAIRAMCVDNKGGL
jgi:hypothetical protein